jgi:hypothetical protein
MGREASGWLSVAATRCYHAVTMGVFYDLTHMPEPTALDELRCTVDTGRIIPAAALSCLMECLDGHCVAAG